MLTLRKIVKYSPIALVLVAGCLQAKTYNKELNVAAGGVLIIATDVCVIDIDSHSKYMILVDVDISD